MNRGTPSMPRSLTVAAGDNADLCPLCGIRRENAGFIKESCGDGLLKPGCFVVAVEQSKPGHMDRPHGV